MSSPARSPGEKPLIEKTMKKPSTELPPIPSLPDDLLMSCFARTSRLYYPTLSLVSKKFPSLLSSPELFKTRSLLGRTESCIYVCLEFSHDPNPRWFALCQKPNRKKKEKNSSGINLLVPIQNPSGKLLVPIPIPNSPEAHMECVVSVGSSVYSIGGAINESPSSSVWVLDCHCLVWRKAPSMRVERDYPLANVFDGKIYVAGGCIDFNSSTWMEVFDPKTQTWEPVLCPLLAETRSSFVWNSAVIEGRIYYMFGAETLAYNPKEDKWEAIRRMTSCLIRMTSCLGWYCVIENVLYCDELGKVKWYDTKSDYWVSVKGLKGLPNLASCGYVKLADYGGKLAVLWTERFDSSGYEETRISCAVIVLERRGNKEIWGTVEWFDTVLTVPNFYRLVCALAPTV